MKKEGKELKIDAPVRGARAGVYMCSATGEGVAQIQMFHVHGAPVDDTKEVSKNLMEGERAVFKCEGAAYPVVEVKWQREDSDGELKDLKPSGAFNLRHICYDCTHDWRNSNKGGIRGMCFSNVRSLTEQLSARSK